MNGNSGQLKLRGENKRTSGLISELLKTDRFISVTQRGYVQLFFFLNRYNAAFLFCFIKMLTHKRKNPHSTKFTKTIPTNFFWIKSMRMPHMILARSFRRNCSWKEIVKYLLSLRTNMLNNKASTIDPLTFKTKYWSISSDRHDSLNRQRKKHFTGEPTCICVYSVHISTQRTTGLMTQILFILIT